MTDIESSKPRLGHIDIFKAFAIFMVLIGHRTDSIILEQYIYSFHLPLFFWVSGYLFNPGKYQQLGNLLSRRLRTLIVPYFTFASISFIFWFFVVRGLSVRGQVYSLDPWYPFWGIFYGIGVEPWRNPLDIALWFLPCLFVSEIFFWSINKYISKRFQVFAFIIFGVIGYCASLWLPFRLPWSADVAITAAVFYGIGYSFRSMDKQISHFPSAWKIIAITLLTALGFTLSVINGKADMNYNFYGNPLFFYCAALAGIYFWYYVIRALPNNRAIAYIGKNTIILVGLLGISSFVIRGFHYLLFGALDLMGKSGIIETVIYSVLEISLLIPVMYVINRFAPFILGRGKYHGIMPPL